jgi:hypothetical protein
MGWWLLLLTGQMQMILTPYTGNGDANDHIGQTYTGSLCFTNGMYMHAWVKNMAV